MSTKTPKQMQNADWPGKKIHHLFVAVVTFSSHFTDIVRSGPEIDQDTAANLCERVSIK